MPARRGVGRGAGGAAGPICVRSSSSASVTVSVPLSQPLSLRRYGFGFLLVYSHRSLPLPTIPTSPFHARTLAAHGARALCRRRATAGTWRRSCCSSWRARPPTCSRWVSSSSRSPPLCAVRGPDSGQGAGRLLRTATASACADIADWSRCGFLAAGIHTVGGADSEGSPGSAGRSGFGRPRPGRRRRAGGGAFVRTKTGTRMNANRPRGWVPVHRAQA